MLKSRVKLVAILVGITVVLGLFTAPTDAALTRIERFNDYKTVFDNPFNFANAVGTYGIRQTWHPDSIGDMVNHTFNLAAGYYNMSWTGDANIGVSNVLATPASVSADITALTGLNGQTYLVADVNASNNFPLKVGSAGGFYFLEIFFSSARGVDDGYPYIFQMTLPGDWSAVGPGPGQHELLGINPLWSIVNDFTFDGANTIFRAELAQYFDDGAHNINVDFILHGGPVPLPPSALLLGSGLCGLAALAWRRRQV